MLMRASISETVDQKENVSPLQSCSKMDYGLLLAAVFSNVAMEPIIEGYHIGKR